MKFLITGITGFAGPHLARLLVDEGHETHGLTRQTNGMETDILDVLNPETYEAINFQYADLTDYRSLRDLFEEEPFDGIFHLAAQSHPPSSFKNPLDTYRTNVTGSVTLGQAIEDSTQDPKIMFCSTSEVYGNSGKDGHTIREDEPLTPSNPYGSSKAAVDLHFQERFSNEKLNGFITRAFSHTGPRRGRTFSISSDAFQLANIKINGLAANLLVGNLSTTRVVMDVRDTVRAYYQLMICPTSSGQVYNICGDHPREMSFFTEKLIEISGLDDVRMVKHEPFWRPHEIYYQHGSMEKAKQEIDFTEEFEIERTLSDLLGYWERKLS